MNSEAQTSDSVGRFGPFGGRYVPETLVAALHQLEVAWTEAQSDRCFHEELDGLLSEFVGRPTPVTEATRLHEELGGARIWLKREDLAHTGAHKINNTLGQALLARRMGKERVIAETGAGQHGVATATACASGANAIGSALRVIQADEADIVITGGAEAALTKIGLASFCSLKALSQRNDEPTRASRPFDADRDGFVLSEGAGMVVVEELQHALGRGANILAELVGYGMSGDGHHITAPDPDGLGAAQAMKLALREAKLKPEDVDYVNAHGTATQAGDLAETGAIKRVFGDYARTVAISSTKSQLGHLLGASGGVEVVVLAKVSKAGLIPPTINLETPDPDCDLDYVPLTAREVQVNIAMSNSFGFGGHNACLVVKRYTG